MNKLKPTKMVNIRLELETLDRINKHIVESWQAGKIPTLSDFIRQAIEDKLEAKK